MDQEGVKPSMPMSVEASIAVIQNELRHISESMLKISNVIEAQSGQVGNIHSSIDNHEGRLKILEQNQKNFDDFRKRTFWQFWSIIGTVIAGLALSAVSVILYGIPH